MNIIQKWVQDFHEKFGCPVAAAPRSLFVKDRMRRARLMCSEAVEFLEAADKNDMSGQIDALADLLYVTFGTAVEMGVDIEAIVAEVHRANMEKEGSKDSGGKVMKGSNWEPPDIEGALEAQGWTK